MFIIISKRLNTYLKFMQIDIASYSFSFFLKFSRYEYFIIDIA